jgi:transcriptional regulator of acetoin/glycerol metabolism
MLFPDRPDAAIVRSPVADSGENLAGLPADLLQIPFRDFQERSREHYEKMYLKEAIKASNGVMTWAAKRAGLPRQTFYRLINKYKLRGED